jgi:hypothetical protein
MRIFDLNMKLEELGHMVKAAYVADRSRNEAICHIVAGNDIYEIIVGDTIKATSVPLRFQSFSRRRHVDTVNASEISWNQMVAAVADNLVDIV